MGQHHDFQSGWDDILGVTSIAAARRKTPHGGHEGFGVVSVAVVGLKAEAAAFRHFTPSSRLLGFHLLGRNH